VADLDIALGGDGQDRISLRDGDIADDARCGPGNDDRAALDAIIQGDEIQDSDGSSACERVTYSQVPP
jgi:hypothetical protein